MSIDTIMIIINRFLRKYIKNMKILHKVLLIYEFKQRKLKLDEVKCGKNIEKVYKYKDADVVL